MKIKINPDGTLLALTAGEITKIAIEYFTAIGFMCWRNNQIPQRGRPFRGKLGVPDVIGYQCRKKKTDLTGGEMLAVEVKTHGDKLSDEQKKFLIDLNKAGGYGYVACDDGKGGVQYYLYLNDKSC